MIPVTPLLCEFESARPIRFQGYPGSVWRSALGATLRRSVCITGQSTCDDCPVHGHCAYGQLFEPGLNPAVGHQGLNLPSPPRAYVLAPLDCGESVAAGTPLRLELTLIGSGREALPAVLPVLGRLSLNGSDLRLNAVRLRPPAPTGLVTRAVQLPTTGFSIVLPECPPAVRIRFTHPLRLQQQGRPLKPADWTVGAFVTALLRRVSALAGQCGRPLESDHRSLIDHAGKRLRAERVALTWVDGERPAGRHPAPVPLGGVVGSVVVRGELAPVWPFLWAGQWFHVGKGAVMGLGRYRLDLLN